MVMPVRKRGIILPTVFISAVSSVNIPATNSGKVIINRFDRAKKENIIITEYLKQRRTRSVLPLP